MTNGKMVHSEVSGGVLTLTLDRPAVHNALNHEMLDGLFAGLRQAASRPDVRVVVIAAKGPNFSAGIDLAHMKRLNTMAREDSVADGMQIAELLAAIHKLAQPTIAAVQGPVVGGGLALVAACDLLLASDAARFSAAETRLGLVPVLLTPYLIEKIGRNAARRLLLTCDRIDAHEALRIGLADQVVAAGDLPTAVADTAHRIAKSAPGALAATKKLLSGHRELPLSDASMREAAEMIATARAGAEAGEGIAAFLAKGKPSWAPATDLPS